MMKNRESLVLKFSGHRSRGQCCTQIVDSECKWTPPKHEFTSRGFSVSSDTVMGKRLREQVSAVITALYFVILQLT